MPVEVIETTDVLTDMVQFRTSPVYEMIVSLHTLRAGRRHKEWAANVRAVLGRSFMAELEATYGVFGKHIPLIELAVDYSDHQDVLGFIHYVRAMPPPTFAFYVTGRVLPLDEIIRTNIDPDAVAAGLTAYWTAEGYPSHLPSESERELLKDIPAYQQRLTALWERYWNEYLHEEIEGLAERWSKAIIDKERILARDGGQGLYEYITGKQHLPGPLPSTMPVGELVCVPLYYVTGSSYLFFGYGNVTILFDSEATVPRQSEIEKGRDEVLQITKALSDLTRLHILRLIALQNGKMNGKRIAEKLDLSPSSVSRQLAQLRDSGLITEERQDDQSVTYSMVREAISSLPDKLLDYLHS